MQISAPALRVLKLLFQAGSTTISRPRLARHTGLDQPALTTALDELTHHGLIDARRLRLTFPGLALAAATTARATKRTSANASASTVTNERTTTNAAKSSRLATREDRRTAPPIALFSRREPPRAVA